MMDLQRATEATDHLLSVARCPIVVDCLTGRAVGHPCEKLVLSQWSSSISAEERAEAWSRWHQLPEAWAGHLRTAPLLFVASNPGLRRKIARENLPSRAPDHITTWEREDAEIIRRSVTALSDIDIESVPYWRKTHELAAQIFGPTVGPGRRHLERVLRAFVDHYNSHRPHRSLSLTPPAPHVSKPRTVRPPSASVERRDRLGGLIHEYSNAA